MNNKCICGAVKKKNIIVHSRHCARKMRGEDDWSKNEIFAIDEFTCGYPDGLSFEQVMELIEQEKEEVIIYEPYEYDSGDYICEKINEMIWSLDKTYSTGKK